MFPECTCLLNFTNKTKCFSPNDYQVVLCKLSNYSLTSMWVVAMLRLCTLPVPVLLVWRNTPTRHWYQPAYICWGNAPTMHPGYINVHRILCHTPSRHWYPLCTCAKAMHWPGTTPLTTGYVWRNDSNWYRYWYMFIILTKYVTYVRLVGIFYFNQQS